MRVDLNVVGDVVGDLVEVLLFWLWGDDFGDGVVLFVVVGVVVGVFDGGVGVGLWGDDSVMGRLVRCRWCRCCVWDDDLSDRIICSVLFGGLFLSNFVVPRCSSCTSS